MFKKIRIMAIALIFGTKLFALSEGVEYNVLENPISDSKNLLTEVWSYQCSHCYLHHKFNTLGAIKEQLKDLKIDMLMVKSWGEFGTQMANLLVYAKYQDEKNNREISAKNSLYDDLSEIYFIDFFKNKNTWEHNPNEFYKIGLNKLDISQKKLEKFLESPEGKYLLSENDKADEIANSFGTPAFIVNGKYVINLAYAKSPKDLIEIIKALLKLN